MSTGARSPARGHLSREGARGGAAPGPEAMAPDRDLAEVARALTAFVNAQVMARGRPMQPDDPFEDAGVDSMGLLRVLLFVEIEFGFWMPDEDLVDEHLASPSALARYIVRRRNPPSPS